MTGDPVHDIRYWVVSTVSALLLTGCASLESRYVKAVRDPAVALSKHDPIFAAIAPKSSIEARKLLEPFESVLREEGFNLVTQKEAKYVFYLEFRGFITKNWKTGSILGIVYRLAEGGDKYEQISLWEAGVQLKEADFADARGAIRTLVSKYGAEFDGEAAPPPPAR